MLSARSASTFRCFGHHSTFAQAVRFLPFSHLPGRPRTLAGSPPFKIPTVRCKRPLPPAPCELCDKSSTAEWRHPSLACLASHFPRGWASAMAYFAPDAAMAPVRAVIRPPRLTLRDSSIPRCRVAQSLPLCNPKYAILFLFVCFFRKVKVLLAYKYCDTPVVKPQPALFEPSLRSSTLYF